MDKSIPCVDDIIIIIIDYGRIMQNLSVNFCWKKLILM